jgi:hypothetical protein
VLETTIIRVKDKNHYRVDSAATVTKVGGTYFTHRVISNTLALFERRSISNTVLSRSWEQWTTLPPPFFPRVNPDALERLVDDRVPFVDLADVDRLVASGIVTDSGTAILLGRQARILEIPGGSVTSSRTAVLAYREYVDSEHGIKLGSETTRYGPVYERVQGVGLDLNATMPLTDFDSVTGGSKLVSGFYSRQFTPGDGYDYPSSTQYVLVPSCGTIAGDYSVAAAQYITSTEVILGVQASGWMVTSELEASGNRYAIVVQAPDGDFTPSSTVLNLYWPGDWSVADPTEYEDSPFALRSAVSIGGVYTGELYTMADDEPGKSPLPFKYMVTWLSSGVNRVMLLAPSTIGGPSDVIALASAFVGCTSSTPVAPTTTMTPSFTATTPVISTQTATAPPPSTFAPVADAYTLSTNPTQNYGSASVLNIRDSSSPYYRTYLKFDVSGLSGTVMSAILRLWVSDTSVDYGQVGSVSNSWTETGLTWNNQPSMPMSFLTVSGPENGYVTVDVWSEITGNGTYSFGIQSLSTDLAAFASREDSNADHRPLLTITTQ